MIENLNNNEDFDFKKAFEESFHEFHENTIIKARVLEISSDIVFLNFGYKAEAKIPTSEFEVLPKVGDEIEVYLMRLEGYTGEPIVSKKKVDYIKEKESLKKIKRENIPVTGTVVEVNRSGAFVMYKNVRGYIPLSLFDNNPVKLEDFVNKEISFFIERLELNQENYDNKKKTKEDFLGNRKRFLYERRNDNKNKFFEDKKVGDIVEGTVKTFTDFGAFVDLQGIDALLRNKDASWYRFNNINEILKENQKIKVIILSLNATTQKCAVGLKQLQDDPWDKFVKEYKAGDVVTGNVVSIVAYGAFVKIVEGVEGLLHISDMSWIKKINNPSELLKVGQNLELKIINLDEKDKKVSLSLKHLLENPWDNAAEKYKVGTRVKSKIKEITSFGCFLDLEEGIDALLHIEDVSWTDTIKNPNEYFKIGQEIEAVVIVCDAGKMKIKVGIKQLEDDPWKTFKTNNKSGDVIKCKVESVDEEKGVYVEVAHNIKTLIPLSHLSDKKRSEIIANLRNDFKHGDEIQALITLVDLKNKKINLSIKDLIKMKEREHVKDFLHNDKEDSVYTLSDSFNLKNIQK